MWDVADSVDDEFLPMVSVDTSWKVSNIRLEFGPAPTIGDLLAALSEVMNFSRVVPYDLEFFEAPEGTYMYTACELPHLDVGVYDVLAPLVHGAASARD
jgi:hypothetical protein